MQHTAASFFCAFVLAGSPAFQVQAARLPSVRVLATGGTIAGAQASATSYDYKPGTYDVQALLETVPHLEKLALVTGEQIANIGSYDMTGALWLRLGRRVNEVLVSPDSDAVLITHGTDTLEETAYFLSLVTKSDKPVVVVGSMRPATALSPDGPANIYNGVAVATSADARGKGTLVVLNDTIHYARNLTKTDTTGVQTFASLNRGPAGLVHTGTVDWFEPMDRKVGRATEFSLDGVDSLPRVDVLYAYADMNADLVDAAVHGGSKGIVIAGMGNGSMPTPVLDALTKAAKSGVVVVRSTRVSSGVVLRNSGVFNDDERGFVVSGELNPAKSRVLLQLALTKTKDPHRIQKMFYEY
jgi:L-asparaginase